jgi:hypothetical protein
MAPLLLNDLCRPDLAWLKSAPSGAFALYGSQHRAAAMGGPGAAHVREPHVGRARYEERPGARACRQGRSLPHRHANRPALEAQAA